MIHIQREDDSQEYETKIGQLKQEIERVEAVAQ